MGKKITKKYKGGMMIPRENNVSVITSYLENSTIDVISKGSFGMVFISKLKNEVPVPYLSMNPGPTFGTPISSLVFKLCLIRNMEDDPDFEPFKKSLKLMFIEEEEFKNEINIQTDIFMKTMNYLQPICPAIVFSDIFHYDELKEPTDEENVTAMKMMNFFRIFEKIGQTVDLKIGLIAMEVVAPHEYNTLYNLPKNIYNIARMQCLFLLIKLALDTEYTHGDHHRGNLLYNPEDTTYFKGVKGHPLLIDFGRTTKIPPDAMRQFRTFCANHQYTDALKLLCNAPTANEYISELEYADPYYGWACGNYKVSNSMQTDWTDWTPGSSASSTPISFLPSSPPPVPPSPSPSPTISTSPSTTSTSNSQIQKNPSKFVTRLRNLFRGGDDYDDDLEDFPEYTNETIKMLFIQREEAIDDIVREMNELHDSNPTKYPLLPLSNQMKNRVYNGMLRGGGGKRQRRQNRTKKVTKTNTKRIKKGIKGIKTKRKEIE